MIDWLAALSCLDEDERELFVDFYVLGQTKGNLTHRHKLTFAVVEAKLESARDKYRKELIKADNRDPEYIGNRLLDAQRPGERLSQTYDRLFNPLGRKGDGWNESLHDL